MRGGDGLGCLTGKGYLSKYQVASVLSERAYCDFGSIGIRQRHKASLCFTLDTILFQFSPWGLDLVNILMLYHWRAAKLGSQPFLFFKLT